MSRLTIDAIKEAISELPEQEKVSLSSWLNIQTMDEWDREMQRDFSTGGRGHHLVSKIKEEIRAGRFRPMSECKSHKTE